MSHQLPTILSPPTPCTPVPALTVPTAGQVADLPLSLFRADFRSGLRLYLAGSPLHQAVSSSSFLLIMDWSFASGCSPHHLSATQFPSATDSQCLSDEDFHLIVGAHFQVR